MNAGTMAAEKATAIVLRTIDFSESSLVVTLLTRESGKVRGLAKGAKRLKAPFESALDLLGVCRIVFFRKTSDALDLVTEAKLVRRFRVFGAGLAALYAGYYTVELVRELTHDHDPHPGLYDLTDQTLDELAAGQPVARRLFRFELAALGQLGHLPSLDTCVECGTSVELVGRVAFGHLEGGVLCPKCRGGKRQVASVSAGTLRAMAQYAAPGQAWRRTEIDRRTQGEMRGLLNHYLCHLLGKKPRMHQYLGQIVR